MYQHITSRTRNWIPPRLALALLLLAVSLGALWYSLNTTGIVWADASGLRADERSATHVSGPRGPLEQFDLDNLQVPADQLLTGGPPKDGIPALTTADVRSEDQRLPGLDGQHPPHFVPASDASFLKPDDRVLGVQIAGEARAYSRSPYKAYFEHARLMFPVPGVTPSCPTKSRSSAFVSVTRPRRTRCVRSARRAAS